MVITFDIGNTHILIGLFDCSGKIIEKMRISSRETLTEDELFSSIYSFFKGKNIKLSEIKKAVISSVVPKLNRITIMLCEKHLKIKPIVVTAKLPIDLSFSSELDNPSSLGNDRLVNCLEAYNLFPNNNIVIIDMGTATTFDVIKQGVYVGGCILAGVRLSLNALNQNTSQLPNVNFKKPKTVLGKNTVEHINIGAYYGTLGQLKEILVNIKKEICEYKLILTGGYSHFFHDSLSQESLYLPDLNLNGLFNLSKKF